MIERDGRRGTRDERRRTMEERRDMRGEGREKNDEKYEHIFAKLITMERKADTFCKG